MHINHDSQIDLTSKFELLNGKEYISLQLQRPFVYVTIYFSSHYLYVQNSTLSSTCYIRLIGLVVWFSLRVREVPGSIPGWARTNYYRVTSEHVFNDPAMSNTGLVSSHNCTYNFLFILEQAQSNKTIDSNYLLRVTFGSSVGRAVDCRIINWYP